MDATLASLLSFYLFSTGRRLFAMGEVKKLALAANLSALAAHCDVAVATDEATRALEATWAGDKDASLYTPEARQIDLLVDAALVSLRSALNAEIRDAAPGDPLGEAAVKLEALAFPEGVGAITKLSFVDELAQVKRIVDLLQSAEWASIVTKLGLERRLSRLVELTPTYEAAIAMPTKSVTFDQVKTARAKGQGLMLQAVAMILGQHPSDDAADLDARKKLLGPILRQNEAIREYLKARRAIEDVDPKTGQVEQAPAPAAPVPAGTPPAQAGG